MRASRCTQVDEDEMQANDGGARVIFLTGVCCGCVLVCVLLLSGNLDPWSGGGVQANISATVVAVLVEGGAHHFDLRASTPLDNEGVIRARLLEVEYIKMFLANPTPADPQQPAAGPCVEPAKSGLSNTALVIISVFTTFGAVLLAAFFYSRCVSNGGDGDQYRRSN